MNLSTCKRVVLFNLESDGEGGHFIEFRHFGISARQRAVNRSIKKVINNKKVPDMSKFNDLADFILHNKGSGALSSDSELDDLPESKIVLPEDYQDKKGGTSVSIKLHELGPRLKLRLLKIEEGLCRGNVVFHALVNKSKAEIKKQQDSLKNKRELKERRKKEQEENVKRKQEKMEKVSENKEESKEPEDKENPTKKKVFQNF
jgi:ribosome biogenesis protein SSF1/2